MSNWKTAHVEAVSVWLRRNPQKSLELYYCPKCRMPVIQYAGDEVMEIPGETPMRLPIAVKCRNKDCPRVYYFVSFGDEMPTGIIEQTVVSILA